MKIFTVVLTIIALALIIYNATVVDISNPLGKESAIAIISIIGCICAVLLLLILGVSRKIEKKLKESKSS